ncbi:hypothetical protein FCY78_23550, partial [Escherichia coli]|nr:hypothetical protein [Escherichia coli]
LLCHGTVCVVGKIRDLILQLSKSSIYSTKPLKSPTSLVMNQLRECPLWHRAKFFDLPPEI